MEGDSIQLPPAFKLGERLTRARRDRGMSIEDVAHALRLSPRHISALEDERFDDLHGPTYVRGYLRNYARLVGLPVDEVLAAYGEEARSAPVARPITQPVQRQVRSSDRSIRLVTYLIAVVLAVLVVVWWQGQSGEGGLLGGIARAPTSEPSGEQPAASEPLAAAEQAATEETGDAVDTAATTQEPAVTPLSQSLDAQAAVEASADAPPADAGPADQGATSEPEAPVEPAEPTAVASPPAEAEPVASQAPATPPQAGFTRLSLRYDEACWTDIRDARGERLVYRTVPAGEKLSVTGRAPFRVFFGNAQGVQLEVGGRPFDFSSSVRGVFARFTVDAAQAAQ